jgi:hypothetical protein
MKLPQVLIAADRGHLLAYSVEETPRGPSARLLLESGIPEGVQRLQEQLTDKAGGFPNGGTAGHGNAAAERMTLAAELDNRVLKELARGIDGILTERHGDWGFAAPSELHNPILSYVDPALRPNLKLQVFADLTGMPPTKALEHFQRELLAA